MRGGPGVGGAAPGSLGVALAVAGVAAGAGGALAAGAASISIFTGAGCGGAVSWVSCVSIWLRGARFAVGWFSGLRGARGARARLSSLVEFTKALANVCARSEGKLGSVLRSVLLTFWLDASVLVYASSNKELGF